MDYRINNSCNVKFSDEDEVFDFVQEDERNPV